ncbi:MAG TPA: metalloregulator ArsR/SmtB family transcription factor [Fimbriimonadaceae bacterium]|nr:metalloregulator ArsR/SmtB family transcription factor [Fimbriimonadaceae bacterium]HRE94607.1 metalloregulator ArsR/SmtB family transcription factor [Fimbriimonadaceae bacterium]
MNDIVLLGKALSDPTRVRILHALLHSDLCVCEMVDALELGQSTLSAHLQTIRQAGIVETSRRHKMVSYSLAEEARQLIAPIFRLSEPALSADHRLTRDCSRIQERLGLRSHGQCIYGPGQLDRAEDTKK